MIIRAATAKDASALARLHASGFEDGWTEADFLVWLARPEGMAIVAGNEREAFAFGLALTAGDDAELLTIATDPARRAQGLGRKVFRALDQLAVERSLNRWILEVARNNLPAQGLYRSEGFVEIGVRKAYYKTLAGRVDALVMERPVGSPDDSSGGSSGGHNAA